MNKEELESVVRTFLSKERSSLSEGRTVLTYITTELSFLGVVAVILKLYFEEAEWTIYVTAGLFILVGIMVSFEIAKIRKLRKERFKILQEERKLER